MEGTWLESNPRCIVINECTEEDCLTSTPSGVVSGSGP